MEKNRATTGMAYSSTVPRAMAAPLVEEGTLCYKNRGRGVQASTATKRKNR